MVLMASKETKDSMGKTELLEALELLVHVGPKVRKGWQVHKEEKELLAKTVSMERLQLAFTA